MEVAQGQPGSAAPRGEEGTSLRCCPGLPAVPGECVQADRDVTAERNTRLFMEQVKMRSAGNKQMEMRTRMDGTGRMAAEVWTGAARSAGASVNEMQLNSLVEGGETRCVLSVWCPHACVLAPPPETTHT